VVKMRTKNLILSFVLFFIIGISLASVSSTYELNQDMFISKSVRLNGYPSAGLECNITILDPDETVLASFDAMVNNATTQKHEYTLTGVNMTGFYCYDITCSGGGLNATSSYCDEVTPNGEAPTTASGIFYIGIFAVLLLFFVLTIWGITKFDNIIARFSLFQFGYLLLIAIVFISYMMANDFLTSAPMIVSMFKILFWVVTIAFFPYVLGMMIWVGYSMITIKEIKDMMDHGLPMEEAEGRRKGKKW